MELCPSIFPLWPIAVWFHAWEKKTPFQGSLPFPKPLQIHHENQHRFVVKGLGDKVPILQPTFIRHHFYSTVLCRFLLLHHEHIQSMKHILFHCYVKIFTVNHGPNTKMCLDSKPGSSSKSLPIVVLWRDFRYPQLRSSPRTKHQLEYPSTFCRFFDKIPQVWDHFLVKTLRFGTNFW